jgi:hypothetical protein
MTKYRSDSRGQTRFTFAFKPEVKILWQEGFTYGVSIRNTGPHGSKTVAIVLFFGQNVSDLENHLRENRFNGLDRLKPLSQESFEGRTASAFSDSRLTKRARTVGEDHTSYDPSQLEEFN